MRPNRLIVRAYLARGAMLWLLARVLLAALLAYAELHPFRLTPGAMCLAVALSVMLGRADVGWRRERALLGNLGVRPLHLGVIFAVPAIAGEIAVAVALAGAG